MSQTVENERDGLTEREAIQRAQEGDFEAFECLYKTYSKRVYSICLRMLRNAADAEDLTQQAFMQVFRKIGTFRGESRFFTWVHRVTTNVVLMHLRRKKPDQALVENMQTDTPVGEDCREFGADDASVLGAIDRINLSRALHKLPLGYRRVFLLYDLVGYQHGEIAGILRCSVGCSKSQLHKARKRLRDLLEGKTRHEHAEVTIV